MAPSTGSSTRKIKAEVSGYLVQQGYTEGTFVKHGQLLFQIDARPFQATLDQALGRLAQAQGQLEQARAQLSQSEAQVLVAEANQRCVQLDVERYTPLVQAHAITQQYFDDATQNRRRQAGRAPPRPQAGVGPGRLRRVSHARKILFC